MVLGFQRRFAGFVRSGSKTHTIREDRNNRWKVGVIVDAFVDPRQKTMERLMLRTPCVKIEHIEISGFPDAGILHVEIDGETLNQSEKDILFWSDGFRDGPHSTAQAAEFWMDKTAHGKVFKGKIIHWKFPGAMK